MPSKKRIKFITSLRKKKIREREGLFIIEGDKIIREYLSAGLPVKMLLAKPEFISSVPSGSMKNIEETEEISYKELKGISTLTTPHNAIAVVPIPANRLNTETLFKGITVFLDMIQDPGNMGTIIRAAAWFGINDIICSPLCVDVYNPKVIQATMGALINVNVFYHDLKELLARAREKKIQVFGALLSGKPVYEHKLSSSGIIMLGNESKGISAELTSFVTDKIMIPGPGIEKPGIESLNVGMAASVIFSEFRRRSFKDHE